MVIAKKHGLWVHLDGARIFNAALALGIGVRDLAKYADSVQFCLSKGLAAPVGSVVVGPKKFIEKARKYRRMLGGGMRQAGIIAAPGIIALTKMTDRLTEDHDNAKILAKGLKKINGIKVINPVMTNIVLIDISGLGWTGEQWIDVCAQLGWKTRGDSSIIRLCTHYGIQREDVEAFLEGLNNIICK